MPAVIVSALLCNFQSYEAIAQWIRLLPIEVWRSFGGKWRHTVCEHVSRSHECQQPGVKQFLRLERITTTKGETTVTNLRPEDVSAKQQLQLWRNRWAIENRVSRVKGAVMKEDHSRIRCGHAAKATSIIRNTFVNYFELMTNRASRRNSEPTSSDSTLTWPDSPYLNSGSPWVVPSNACLNHSQHARMSGDSPLTLRASMHPFLKKAPCELHFLFF